MTGFDGFVKLYNSSATPMNMTQIKNSSTTNLGLVDVSKDGNFSVNVTGKEPCYLTLINSNKKDIVNWTISGTNVSADMMRLDFPFVTKSSIRVKNFTMDTSNDIVFLYIGATQLKDSTVKLSWVTPKVVIPQPPVNPQPGSAVSIKNALTLLSLIIIGYVMI